MTKDVYKRQGMLFSEVWQLSIFSSITQVNVFVFHRNARHIIIDKRLSLQVCLLYTSSKEMYHYIMVFLLPPSSNIKRFKMSWNMVHGINPLVSQQNLATSCLAGLRHKCIRHRYKNALYHDTIFNTDDTPVSCC